VNAAPLTAAALEVKGVVGANVTNTSATINQ
jgi:hypothetical protein